MKRIFLSFFIWVGVGVLTFFLWAFSFLSVFIFGLWDRDGRVTHFVARAWSWAMVKMNPFWNLKVEGLENLEKDHHYVFVSNHQSMADIVILPFIQVPYKCFSKASLFNIPCLGWSLSLHQHIKLFRESLRGIARAMQEAKQWIKKRMSVVFFVEGTRSRTGSLGSFKGGAFKLAIQTKTPIIPLVMVGTRDAIPRGSWLFKQRVEGKLVILPAIETASYSLRDSEEIKKRVFDVINKELLSENLQPATKQIHAA